MTLTFRKYSGLATVVLLIGFVLSLSWPNGVLAAPEAIATRLGEHGGRTRFVLDLTESVKFQL